MSKDNTFKQKLFLLVSVFIFSATQVLLFTLFPFLAETLSLSLSEIIFAFSLGTLLFLVGSPFWSDRSDVIGRAKVIKVGLFGLSLSFALIVLLIAFHRLMNPFFISAVLIVSRIIYGLMASAIVPVSQLARKDLASNNQHLSTMLSHSLSLSLGRSAGPLFLLIFLGEIQLLLSLFALMPLMLLFLRPAFPKVVVNEPHGKVPWLKSAGAVKLPLAVTVLFTSYVGILHSSLGFTIESLFSLSGTEASGLMAKVLFAGSVVMTITQLLGKLVLKNNFQLGMIMGLISLTAGAALLALMSTQLELWVAIGLISAGISLIQPSHLAIVHSLFPEDQAGKKIGLLSSGNTIGYALGGGVAALLLDFEIHKISFFAIVLLVFAATRNTMRVRPC